MFDIRPMIVLPATILYFIFEEFWIINRRHMMTSVLIETFFSVTINNEKKSFTYFLRHEKNCVKEKEN